MAAVDNSFSMWGALGAAGAATAALTWSAMRADKSKSVDTSEHVATATDLTKATPAAHTDATGSSSSKGALTTLSAALSTALAGDAAFVYDFVHETSSSAVEAAKDASASADTAELFTGLSTGAGAGAVVRGAVAGGLERVAVVTDSASAVHVLPMVEDLANKSHPAVIHVAAGSAHPKSLTEHADPLSALAVATALQRRRITSHVPVVTSGDTASEVIEGAHLAQQLATASNTPAVHVFGSGAGAFAGAVPAAASGHQADTTPEGKKEELSSKFFHYVGHESATEVFVTLATGSTPLAGAVALLASAGHRVGLIRIRVLRPWSSKDLLAVLPATASSLLVLLPTDSAHSVLSGAASTEQALRSAQDPSAIFGAAAGSSASDDGLDTPTAGGTPLRPGSTAAAVTDILRRSASSTSLLHAKGSSAAARPALPTGRLGGLGDAASVVSSASTFAMAARGGGLPAGGASPSRRQSLRSASSSPTALLAALVDAAASARAADSGAALRTSLLLVPYSASSSSARAAAAAAVGASKSAPGYLATPQGLRVAIDSLSSSPSKASGMWHSLIDAVDALGAVASVRVAGPVAARGRDAAVSAALQALAGPAGAEALRHSGRALVRTGIVVSDAGAAQLSTVVLLDQLAAQLRAGDHHHPDDEAVADVAAVVAVLGVAATTLLLPSAASSAAILDCTAPPSSAAAPGLASASSSGRPRSSLVVLLPHEHAERVGAAASPAASATEAIIALADDDVRAAAAVSIAGPLVVLTVPHSSHGLLSQSAHQHAGSGALWSVLTGSSLSMLAGSVIVEHQRFAVAAAEAESAVLAKLAQEAAEAEAEALTGAPKSSLVAGSKAGLVATRGVGAARNGGGSSSNSSTAWSGSFEESKSQEPLAMSREAALPGLGFGGSIKVDHAPLGLAAHPLGSRSVSSLSSLPHVALSAAVVSSLAGDSAELEESDGATVVEGSVTETKLGVIPPAAPVRVQRGNLQTPKHVALPFMFPEAFRAATAPHPAEPEHLFQATVARKVRLTPDDYDRNVFHIEFDIPEGVRYEMGEALGVFGHNSSCDVDDFLEWYGLNGSDVVTMPSVDNMLAAGNLDLPAGYGETTTVSRAFTQIVDLFGRVTKQFLEALGEYATDADERTNIFFLTTPEGKEAFKALVDDTATMADVLHKFPSAHPPVHDLIAIIPPIKPRHYSIASSQAMHPRQVHLLVVTVEWKDSQSRHRMGHCTRYMDALTAGDTVVVSIKPSVMKLPRDPRAPVIMAGLGTGMAPFRAFIEERAVQKRRGDDVGPMVLYFGSRYRSQEYLYGDELEAYEREGVLTTQRLAFSRDQKHKVYIQHLMQEDGEQLCELLHKQSGSFYLCGPTWPEGPVQDAMESAFATHAGVNGADTVQHLKEAERYILEVY